MRATALLASVAMIASRSAEASVVAAPMPKPTAVSVNAAPRWVPICLRGRGLPGSGAVYDTTDNSVFDVSACWVPTSGAVRAIKLAYAGADFSNDGPVDRPNTVTGYASIALPSTTMTAVVAAAVASGATSIPVQVSASANGNGVSVGESVSGTGIPSGSYVSALTPTYSSGNLTGYSATISAATTAALTLGQVLVLSNRVYPATWGDQRQLSIFPAHRLFESDPISVSLAAGSQFLVRGSWTFSTSAIYPADMPSPSAGSTRLSGEGSQRGSNLPDHTFDPTVPANSGGGYWPPALVLGLLSAPAPSVLIVGDSIAAGTGDAADSYGRMGYLQRSLGSAVPWASIARGSTSATELAANPSILYDFAARAGATDVLLEYGRNDLNAPMPVAAVTLEATLRSLAAPLIAAGVRVWIFTCPPTTTSTDGWLTAVNQAIANTSIEAQRQAFNGFERSSWQQQGYAGLIDMDLVVEDPQGPGKWRTDLGTASPDGVHPSPTLHNALVSAGIVSASMFPAR